MAYLTIPIKDAGELGAFNFVATLDGSDYEFRFQYNERAGYWFFDLLDANKNRIKSSIKVVVNWLLIRTVRTEGRPPGEILFVDTRAIPQDPGLEDLGVDAVLTYIEQESVAA